MKQGKIIAAYNTLIELSEKNALPLRAARALFDLRKKLAPTYEFYEAERIKTIKRLGDEDPLTGNVSVGPGHMVEFLDAKKELDEMDVDIPGLPVRIELPDDMKILPAHLWALDGFADFGEV